MGDTIANSVTIPCVGNRVKGTELNWVPRQSPQIGVRKMIIKYASAITALLLLGGCATQSQRESERMQSQLVATNQQMESCYNSARAKAPGRALSKKMIAGTDNYDFRLLSIDKYATEEDVQNIFAWRELVQPCRKAYIEGMGKVHASFVTVVVEVINFSDINYAKLIERKITFGEANKRWVENSSQIKRRWDEVASSINRDLRFAHQDELAQRRAAATALQQWSYQQQLLNSMTQSKITTTNCNIIGSLINCTSY